MDLNPLTPEEERVIVGKGTEAPFSGEYEKFSAEGVFTCRRCGANLYRSEDKFDAHCGPSFAKATEGRPPKPAEVPQGGTKAWRRTDGWPSFDQEVLGAVERQPDVDGSRTEISCIRCGAHLGHVFTGEGYTPKDTRHCVNSISLKFVPRQKLNKSPEFAYFGGGCFWCTEAAFKMVKGVLSVVPGYAGGVMPEPTYEQVSSGATGHAEVVRVEYDPTQISYEALLQVFFASHDPTTVNRQGVDVGTQYRSAILCGNEPQKEIAEKFIGKLEQERVFGKPIATEVKPLEAFYEAEDYHHDYFAKNPDAAYCQTVIQPKVAKLRQGLKWYLRN